jgi:NADPH-dependent curcumin reductase
LTNCKRWVLRHRPVGSIAPGDLELVEGPLPPLREGEVLVRTVYLSMDPTNRIWMSDQDQYMPPVQIGETMRGGATCVVEESRSPLLAPGDLVGCMAGWASHAVLPASAAKKLQPVPNLPLLASLSALGGTGLTAWFGMCDIGRPRPGETVVVTAAAGAVGSIAAQVAKLKGARVIGIAGGAEKCAWLTKEAGLDGAIDYKAEDVGAALDRLCPNGIDVDFENVGGEIMAAILPRMNDFGRVALCGMISGYNGDGRFPADFGPILMHRLTVRGYIVSDYLARAGEAMAELVPWVRDGSIKYRVHVEQGLETAPATLNRLFTGDHKGKLLVQVSPEP